MKEKEVVDLVKQKVLGFVVGKGGGCFQRGLIKNIFTSMAHSRNKLSSKHRNYKQKNKKHNNKQSIDCDGSKISKIQTSPKIEWGLSIHFKN
jgi:hypothetical protein